MSQGGWKVIDTKKAGGQVKISYQQVPIQVLEFSVFCRDSSLLFYLSCDELNLLMPKGKKETSTKKAKFSPHDRDLPATSSMLEEVRNELKADFRALDHKIDAKFLELKSEFFGIKSEFSGMKSEFSDVKSQIQQVLSAAHRTQALMEEQRRDNKIVMDGHREVNERMDRIEADVKEVRHVVADLARKRKTDLSQ